MHRLRPGAMKGPMKARPSVIRNNALPMAVLWITEPGIIAPGAAQPHRETNWCIMPDNRKKRSEARVSCAAWVTAL